MANSLMYLVICTLSYVLTVIILCLYNECQTSHWVNLFIDFTATLCRYCTGRCFITCQKGLSRMYTKYIQYTYIRSRAGFNS